MAEAKAKAVPLALHCTFVQNYGVQIDDPTIETLECQLQYLVATKSTPTPLQRITLYHL
jgi:hypothetical protein